MRTRLTLVLGFLALAGSAAQAEQPSKFIVFFSGRSATLTPEGRQIVNDAASRIKYARPATVLVSAGVRESGDRLSGPRFQAVRRALVDDGIAPDIIARASIPGPELAHIDGGLSRGDERAEIQLVVRHPRFAALGD
jgi:outer membrane protein OmpA-like peptidoglycan-associated protein